MTDKSSQYGEQTFETFTEAHAYLMRNGNLAVPCSRWGADTNECTAVAWDAALIVAEVTGEPVLARDLDYAMGLAVNDSEDLENLFAEYVDDRPTNLFGYGDSPMGQ